MKCYQRKSSDQKENLSSIEDLTVTNLLEKLRDGYLEGCDTFGLTLGRDVCSRVGLPFPVLILATVNTGLFKSRN
jgi:hypothetical protein